MNLFDRISILMKADAHGVMESLEDRSRLLKQCLRDAEAELERKRLLLRDHKAEAEALTRDESRCWRRSPTRRTSGA